MTTKTLKELVEMCRSGNCSIALEACTTGIVARVRSNREDVSLEKSVWLDANDADAGRVLDNAVSAINKVS
jgi:hypothetical protein